MTEVHHLNCVRIVSPINDNVCGHCVLVKENDRLILVDSGIGLLDTIAPEERIGQELINLVGYRFDENQTAVRQIERMGLDINDVTDCIISHLDNDHIGGLADFPGATVHLATEELDNYKSGNTRYLKTPLSHNPVIKTYSKSDTLWYGFEARKLNIDTKTEFFLIPLFGHTLGHCGVALKINNEWLFYIADAYYMRLELTNKDHPVNQLAEMRADDNTLRLQSLNKIIELMHSYPEIKVFGYHDIDEFNSCTY